MKGIRPGQRLHLSDDGVTQGDPVVVWGEAPGVACWWVQRIGKQQAFKVRVIDRKNAPHPVVKITEEQ